MQTELGEFRLYAYQDRVSLEVHLALARGRLDGPEAPLVRVHLADTLRDLLGVRGAARAWTLRAAHAAHRRGRQRRGGGAARARNRAPSSPRRCAGLRRGRADAGARKRPQRRQGAVLRTFGVGAQILKDLGVRRMRVLSAPKQMHGISAFDLEIEGYVGEEG